MHWTLPDLWAIPVSYYQAIRDMVEEDARERDRIR